MGTSFIFNSSWDDRDRCILHFHPDGANNEHAHFTEELAQQLLTNTFDNVGIETCRSVSLENTILDVDETLAHDIVLHAY